MIKSSNSLPELTFATLIIAAGLALLPTPPAQAQGSDIASACTDAARQYFKDFEAETRMRVDDPRVDGTRTVGGEIMLETKSAYVACAFPAKELRLIEFHVDGEDKLAELQSGGTGSADVPNYERPVGGVLPKGSSFTASSIIQCERKGTGAGQCDVGVVREGNGNGALFVFWPDSGNRVLYFENGEIVRYDQAESDGGAELRVTRNGDVQIVTIGDMRFEVVDAILVGG